MQQLGLHQRCINRLINLGKLKIKKRSESAQSGVLIDAESVTRFSIALRQALTLTDAAKLLGIKNQRVIDLVKQRQIEALTRQQVTNAASGGLISVGRFALTTESSSVCEARSKKSLLKLLGDLKGAAQQVAQADPRAGCCLQSKMLGASGSLAPALGRLIETAFPVQVSCRFFEAG